ncbi:hypothetical protein SLW70_11175 [Flavobacterium sp. NG2]|uniref:hypothetical protein n=1 Tax=Flavobacterium sp. NG2 TaxID=3097547 RepID=UPI002A81D189|nr:hypothetical protein [Flavobacterium sp. NG2]WPR73290.1 hypothetical protein SLW70_11175 [Flavobacterium sp. NG2]
MSMKIQDPNKNRKLSKSTITKVSDLQKLYIERLERFMALVELSYALKTAPRIIQKK